MLSNSLNRMDIKSYPNMLGSVLLFTHKSQMFHGYLNQLFIYFQFIGFRCEEALH